MKLTISLAFFIIILTSTTGYEGIESKKKESKENEIGTKGSFNGTDTLQIKLFK